ncbi:gamma-tubulin complex component protein [Powellomyces hirtus]|nr:gamma-tubulin complex component protein [Powellomyces hirtus]
MRSCAAPNYLAADVVLYALYLKKCPLRTWEMLRANPASVAQQADEGMVSPYLTESSLGVFNDVYRNHFLPRLLNDQNVNLPSESALLQDILNLVLGLSSATFAFSHDTMTFEIAHGWKGRLRSVGCTEMSFASYLDRFLAIGTFIRRLDYVVEVVEGNIQLCGQTGLAFGHALSSYLAFVRACLAVVHDQLDGGATVEQQQQQQLSTQLQRLYWAVDGSYHQLEMIAAICRCDVPPIPATKAKSTVRFDIPLGSDLLSRIYDSACALDTAVISPTTTGNTLLRIVLLGMLEYASRPYLTWLEQWLGLSLASHKYSAHMAGVLEKITDVWDPYAEFFVAFEEMRGGKQQDNNSTTTENDEDDADKTGHHHRHHPFWQAEWQLSQNVAPPSFLPPRLVKQVLHAGKYLRLLRSCQPDHPLLTMRAAAAASLAGEGEREGDESLWAMDLAWCYSEEEVEGFHAAADSYIRHIKSVMAADTQALAARTLAQEEQVSQAAATHRESRARRLQAHQAALLADRQSKRDRQQAAQADIQQFLQQRDEAKRKEEWEREEEETEKKKKVETEREKRDEVVRQERERMVTEHETRVRELERREQRVEWKRQRVELARRRREVVQERRRNEEVDAAAMINQAATPHPAPDREVDADATSGVLMSPDASFVTADDGSESEDERMRNHDPPPRGEESGDESMGDGAVIPDTLSGAEADVKMGAGGVECSGSGSPSTSVVELGKSAKDARPQQQQPQQQRVQMQFAATTAAAAAAAAPAFTQMGSIGLLMEGASAFSPFFAPGLGADVGRPVVETEVGVEVDVGEGTREKEKAEEEGEGEGGGVTEGETDEERSVGQAIIRNNETSEEEPLLALQKRPQRPQPDHRWDLATPPSSTCITCTPSFAQFLESHMASAERNHTTTGHPSTSLHHLTTLTLHRTLSSISALISKATLDALYPQLCHHLGLARRYVLLGDPAFCTRVVDALFRSEKGLRVDARRRHHRHSWPPGFGELATVLQGVVGADMEEEEGRVEFEGVPAGGDVGALDALKFLRLRYTAPAPYDMILTRAAMEKYEAVFAFLLVLHRAHVALDHVCAALTTTQRCGSRSRRTPRPAPSSSSLARRRRRRAPAVATTRLLWDARAFVGGFLRYAVATGVAAVGAEFDIQVGTMRHQQQHQDYHDHDHHHEGTSLETMHALHHTHLDRILWRLLLNPKQRPIMVMVEGMLQIVIRFARGVTRVDSDSDDSDDDDDDEETQRESVATLLAGFRIRYAMLVKVLGAMVDKHAMTTTTTPTGTMAGGRRAGGKRSSTSSNNNNNTSSSSARPAAAGGGKEMACFNRLLAEIDGNGYVAKRLVPNLATLQSEMEAL